MPLAVLRRTAAGSTGSQSAASTTPTLGSRPRSPARNQPPHLQPTRDAYSRQRGEHSACGQESEQHDGLRISSLAPRLAASLVLCAHGAWIGQAPPPPPLAEPAASSDHHHHRRSRTRPVATAATATAVAAGAVPRRTASRGRSRSSPLARCRATRTEGPTWERHEAPNMGVSRCTTCLDARAMLTVSEP